MTKETNLISLEPESMPRSAEWIISLIENVGGNLKKFIEKCPENEHLDDERIISGIELWLSGLEDKSFLRRWNAAIKHNQIVRLRLLQEKTLARLEHLASDSDPSSWLAMAKESMAHKMILADLLAGQTHSAKQKHEAIPEKDDDDADIAEVMAGA